MKKAKGKDEARLNKVLAQESAPFLITQNKGKTRTSVGSLIKKASYTPSKNKEKEQVLEPSE